MSNDALILAKLDTLEGLVRQLLAGNSGARPAQSGGAGHRGEGDVASDRDLDSERGNPTIKFDPKSKYWDGASYEGYKFSEVPEPAYLDAMAKYLDACAYMAAKEAASGKDVEKNEKSARFKRLDAARARGWAARIRANGVAAPQVASTDYTSTDDDIPF